MTEHASPAAEPRDCGPLRCAAPDTRSPGFAEEAARQCRLLTEWEATPEGRAEIAFWDKLAAEAWRDLDSDR